MHMDITPEEQRVLIGWKKRSGRLLFIQLKAEAIGYASRGVDLSIIAEMVDRAVSTRTPDAWPHPRHLTPRSA